MNIALLNTRKYTKFYYNQLSHLEKKTINKTKVKYPKCSKDTYLHYQHKHCNCYKMVIYTYNALKNSITHSY